MEIFLLIVLIVACIAWTQVGRITKFLSTPSPPASPAAPPKKKSNPVDRNDPENAVFFGEVRVNLRVSPSYRSDFKSPWEEEDSHRPQPFRPCDLRIRYTDAQERNSERDIAIYKNGATNYQFDAWCSLRRARRTFFFSRIQSAIDLETGEVLSVAQLFRRVHPTRKVPKEIAFL